MFTRRQLQKYIDEGLISEQKHFLDEDICIYNYTHKCQFSRAWDEITLNCRGLIINWKTGEIVARPFPKFFNYGEHKVDIPNEEPIITDKLDGSLGILYFVGDKPFIATRGSFTSDQAGWATRWWRENVKPDLRQDTYTHLFEIIYPENKIVVNYDFSGLVYLASIEKDTGIQQHLEYIYFPKKAERFAPMSLESLSNLEEKNKEGFVVFYPSTNLRLKIKFEEYKRLHRILTNVSPKSIWELLKDGGDVLELIQNVPDEFYKWVTETVEDIQQQYVEIESKSREEFKKANEEFIKNGTEERKDFAEGIKKMTYPSIGFSMLDNKDYSQIIWKMIKPKVENSFKRDIDA